MRFLKQAEIENFRSIRNASVEFGNLTVFVGPNGSGKSNLIAALQGPEPHLHNFWMQRLDSSFNVSLHLNRKSDPIARRTAELKQGGQILTGPQDPTWPDDDLQALRFEPRNLREAIEVRSEERLTLNGSNAVNVFASTPRVVQAEIAAQFSSIVPVFRDVDVVPEQNQTGVHRFRFWDRWTESLGFHPRDVSEGSLLALALLIVGHQPKPAKVVMIEDLERGVHPFLLEDLVQILRSVAQSETGPQIIVTTHSSVVLDCLEPAELRVVSRDRESGGTVFTTIDETSPSFQSALEEYNGALGELWLSGALYPSSTPSSTQK